MRRLSPDEAGWDAAVGIVRRALAEDIGAGDITTELSVAAGIRATGEMIAKQCGVVAGVVIAAECFRQLDQQVRWDAMVNDGDEFTRGDVLARVAGDAHALLAAERSALNLLQRLSGIATLTRQYVRAVEGTSARIVDTRKTTPGLRLLEKAAVLAGGAGNHRYALYDGVLLKDNHIAVAGGVRAAVLAARTGAPHTLKVEVETTSLAQVAEALEAGADVIMLDNMDCSAMAQAVRLVAGRAITEASGNVSLETVREIAETGVNIISVGKLTHSAPAADISLNLQVA
jgi:nicotinate-nucleotide pyrophosphorylase (carboxylating)